MKIHIESVNPVSLLMLMFITWIASMGLMAVGMYDNSDPERVSEYDKR